MGTREEIKLVTILGLTMILKSNFVSSIPYMEDSKSYSWKNKVLILRTSTNHTNQKNVLDRRKIQGSAKHILNPIPYLMSKGAR